MNWDWMMKLKKIKILQKNQEQKLKIKRKKTEVEIPINQRTTLKIRMAHMKIEEMREKIRGKESIKGNKLSHYQPHVQTKKWMSWRFQRLDGKGIWVAKRHHTRCLKGEGISHMLARVNHFLFLFLYLVNIKMSLNWLDNNNKNHCKNTKNYLDASF